MHEPDSGIIEGFVRGVTIDSDQVNRLQRGVELAVQLVDGCDCAGVTILSQTGVETEAATDDLVWIGDARQYEFGEGPCLDSVAEQETVVSQNLVADRRWPRWSPWVVEHLGVRAMLSLLLYTDRESLGALNLYARSPHCWTSEGIAVAGSLATHLAVAVADAREIEHRDRAIVNRTMIGQAEGILMERLGLTGEQAFSYLRRVSQDTNIKLTQVAGQLVTTRRLPDAEPEFGPAGPRREG